MPKYFDKCTRIFLYMEYVLKMKGGARKNTLVVTNRLQLF